jgi:transcriptional regulator with XRE-family HTH domain
MNKELWTEEDALLLKQLREALGLDTMALAIQNAMSNAQIQQLENGGNTSFYSPAIKAQTGRRLLHKLQVRKT